MADVFEEVGAYAFKSDLSLKDMFAKLAEGTTWEWLERENDYFGEYLSATSDEADRILRIFQEKDHYAIDLWIESGAPEAKANWQALDKRVVDKLLPMLGAREIEPTEDYW